MVTVFTGKAEVGQNIRTSLSQAVAEELRLPIAAIVMVMADTQLVPWDAGTFGSRSTPDMGAQLHRAAAAAREALLDLAAAAFKTDRAALTVADGKIFGAGKTATYAELTKGQKLVKTVDESAPRTPATEWKIAGTSVPKVNGRDFVTGKHRYSSDIKRPGMLRGKILRPTAFDATLTSLDTKAAEAMPGVTVVHDGNFVGVVAANELLATKAIEAIHAEWNAPSAPSSDQIFDYIRKNVSNDQRGGRGSREEGSMDAGLAAADIKLSQTYTVAYIAHTPLEPRAAVAEWQDDKLTVWTGTQRPFGIRTERRARPRHPGRPCARHHAGHRLGLRRQTHRGRRHRSRAPGQGRGQAGQSGMDARRGIHLGLLSPLRRHRRLERRPQRRNAYRLGISQLQFRQFRHRHALRSRE